MLPFEIIAKVLGIIISTPINLIKESYNMHNNSTIDYFKISFIALLFITMIIYATPEAFAAEDALTGTLCNVVNALQGTLGKAIATIAVIVLGVGLFLGKLSWPLAIATAIGIGLIFGATSIVEWVSAGDNAGGTFCDKVPKTTQTTGT